MGLFRRRSDDDFKSEIDAHIGLEIDRLVADGWSPADARTAAVKRFGNVTAARERFRESTRIRLLDELRQDARHALRAYRRGPGFVVATVLTLALAIGATSAVFTLADPMLFRPLPYPDADRLVVLSARGAPRGQLLLADYLRARELATNFTHVRRGIPSDQPDLASPHATRWCTRSTRDFWRCSVCGRSSVARSAPPSTASCQAQVPAR